MIETIFKNRKLNTEKLLSFGFENAGSCYTYHTGLVDGQLTLTVKIDTDGKINTDVIDNNSGDEYVLYRVEGAEGAFVGQVKSECEAVLERIAENCFDLEVFKCKQSKEVIAYIKGTYGDEPEFLWQKFTDSAAVRRKDNQKWYAVILTVSRRKLGFDADEKAEIIDLRMKPEDVERLTDGVRILPGYHMNKKHWVTICLDGTVPTEEICQKIDESYLLAKK